MCEYCHLSFGHRRGCPNESEGKIRGYCKECGEKLTEKYEYYEDNNGNKFCSNDCAIEYHGINSKEWDYEQED